jgi:hypothetical protein
VRAGFGSVPPFTCRAGSNFLFEPTRCDSGAKFGNRAPRGSTRRWALSSVGTVIAFLLY